MSRAAAKQTSFVLAAALAFAAACAAPPEEPHAVDAEPVAVALAGPAAPAASTPAPAPQVFPDPARVERALGVMRVEDLRTDVHFLASDELAGRGTPSTGQRIAARFLRARMERLGWTPGAEQGWFHPFELQARRIDARGTRATWRSGASARVLVYRTDFGVHPTEAVGGSWSGGLAFAGSGRAEELSSPELAGRWAVCIDTPGATRDHAAARAAGALGFLLLPDGSSERAPPFADWHQRLQRPFPRWPLPQDGAALPTLRADRDFARELLVASSASEYVQPGTLLAGELEASVKGPGTIVLENVCALWPGEGPRASEVLIVSAHYDHVGVSWRTGEIYNGADDNASGSAGLLAVAEALSAHGPLERSVLLLWLSAEELGLLGARAWTEKPWLPEGMRAVANINLDMIGRNAPDQMLLTPSHEHPERNPVADTLERALNLEGFVHVENGDEFWDRSDHAMFAQNMGLPVAFACNGEHEDYHQPSDTPEKLDYDKAHRAARATVRALLALQRGALEAAPAPAPGQ